MQPKPDTLINRWEPCKGRTTPVWRLTAAKKSKYHPILSVHVFLHNQGDIPEHRFHGSQQIFPKSMNFHASQQIFPQVYELSMHSFSNSNTIWDTKSRIKSPLS
jgi:hypothetical protein